MKQVISDYQRSLNAALHQQDPSFGKRSEGSGLAVHLPAALRQMHELGVCQSVLDYGTGKGDLVQCLRSQLPSAIAVSGYDPAIPAFEAKPEAPADILTCLDVLEHTELASIDAVLRDIYTLTRRFCYLVIDLQPAVKTLADGRNAHILLAPSEWWVSRVAQLFACQASFPVMHRAGLPGKLVIAACHDPQIMPAMYGFLIKLNLFHKRLGGGILEGMVQQQQKLAR